MSESGNIEPAIDIDELKEIMDDDLELIQDCFSDFLDDWPSVFADIKEAADAKDAVGLNESSHKLKGTLKYLAAEAAADAAYELELAGKDNNMKGLSEKVAKLGNELDNMIDFIKDFNG